MVGYSFLILNTSMFGCMELMAPYVTHTMGALVYRYSSLQITLTAVLQAP